MADKEEKKKPFGALKGDDPPKDEDKKDDDLSTKDEKPEPDKPAEKEPEVKDIDADSIIDAFLEENPDLVDTPVDEWPPEAIEMLKETFNSENVDAPNGVLPDEESSDGEPAEEPPADEVDGPPITDEGEEDPEQDFDIAELAKLVEAGDKDGAWNMLQSMFGITPAEPTGPTNALDRMVGSESSKGSGNALAKLIAGLR